MSDLSELISLCKSEVLIEVNSHTISYQSVEEYFEDNYETSEKDEITDDVMAKMIELNTIVWLCVYPDTPIGSYRFFHYDIDIAVGEMLKHLKGKQSR